MAFTYNTATDIGKVRLELDDTEQGKGVRPNGDNLTDAEIQVFLDREGAVLPAVAAACEMLARAWSRVASLSAGGRSEQFGAIAKEYADRAAVLRAQHGGGGAAISAGAVREDAYTENAETETEFTN